MRIHKLIASQVFTLTILFSLHTPAMAKVETHECSSDSSAKICQTQRTPKKNNKHSGTSSTGDNIVTENNNSGSQSQNSDTYTSKAPNGLTMVYSKTDPTLNACITKDGRVGHVNYANRFVRDDGISVDHGLGKRPTSEICIPDNARTLTGTNNPGPTGPTYEEVMEEIRHAAESLEPGKPTLHQSYNNPAGTGRAEGDPNVYKGDQINFYVDDGGPYRLEADMLAGHVEIELMPSSYVIEYGNGDTDTNYTAGKPVTTYPRERPRQTDTSYAYKRSGNFHAYATVHYTARFRVDGGPWQMMMVTPQATSDPLLVRVWWVDVGRVGGTCDEDDTRWGCKNDPTMGKKDNPNPRLRKADIRTGQRWHLNDSGDGDTEYSLHRDWPDM